jgi:hypothetical protein
LSCSGEREAWEITINDLLSMTSELANCVAM